MCAGGECVLQSGHGGTEGDEPFVGGSSHGGAGTPGAGGRGGSDGRGGTNGGAGSAGAGGTSEAGGAGGAGVTTSEGASGASSGASGASGAGGSSSTPACWVISLNEEQQAIDCLGIDGWNDIEVNSPSSVAMTYEDGKACFDGTIATSGWGAVYNFAFNANENDPWNAASRGVGGFELLISGSLPPPRIDFKYTDDDGDCCRTIAPVTTVELPFTSTHPGCVATGRTPDPTQLKVIRLAMTPRQAAYDIDFCVQLRATP